MTIAGLVWAWDQRGLTAEEKLVLLALGDESSDASPPPSLVRVAENATSKLRNLSQSSVHPADAA
jgi:hypothetical protein